MATQNIAKDIREAIRAGDLKRVKALIGDNDKRLAMMTPFGTWLHVASSFGQYEIVKYLVERGADVNARGGIEGGAPLDAAASEGHVDIVRVLLAHGALMDTSEPERNPLFGAIYGGHAEVAKVLIDAGIDTTVKYTGESMKNMDALAFAREQQQPEIERMLRPAKRRS
jgi:ankyrin repeat protein